MFLGGKHKGKFRSSISKGWYNLVESAELRIRLIREKTSELSINCTKDVHS